MIYTNIIIQYTFFDSSLLIKLENGNEFNNPTASSLITDKTKN
jgi:hypothetical protein